MHWIGRWLILAACVGAAPSAGYSATAVSQPNRIEEKELVVITSESLLPAWQLYVDWKRSLGLPCAIVAIESIEAQQQGPDKAARIRTFIEHAHQKWKTRFVLLGADSDLLPPRLVPCKAYNAAEDSYLEGPVATDLYYADLDGNWDKNGNGVYGELEDACDLMPDIAVGRVPARTQAEVLRWVVKLRAYESASSPDYQHRLLLLGEKVATFLGSPVCSTLALEGTIVRDLPSGVELVRLYDDVCSREGSRTRTEQSQLRAISDGVSLILNYGHGMWDWLGAIPLMQIPKLDNAQRPAVYITTECNGCEFAYPLVDHVACESFLLSDGGGVAYLGNTEFGVGVPWLMAIYKILFNTLFTSPATALGEAVASAQREYSDPALLARPMLDQRWQQFVLVLMGDPSMRVRTQRPMPLTLETQTAQSAAGTLYTFQVTSQGIPVPDAAVTVYAPEAFLYTQRTDAQGSATILTPTAPTETAVRVSATAVNSIPAFASF